MAPHVRAARYEDVPALIALLQELALPSAGGGPPPSAAPEAYAAAFADIVADTRQQLLVVEADGQVAGSLVVVMVPNLSHGGRPWAIVENVIVGQSFRRRGLARALFSAAIDRARAAGCYKVALTSNLAREEAHRFYEGLGFVRYAWGYRLDL